MSLQNGVHIFLYVGGVFEHHVQIPETGHAILTLRTQLLKNLLRPAFGNEYMVRYGYFIIIPIAAQRKGFRRLLPIHQKRHGELIADDRLHPQQGEDSQIRSRLVGTLFWEPPFDWFQKHPFCRVFVAVTDLHMAFMERLLLRHTTEYPISVFLNQRIIF